MSSINLSGDTSGTLILTVPAVAGSNTITLPSLTGTIITTASTSGIPNTINWTTVQTSSVNPAVAGTGYPMNTTSGALTVTLPAAPTAGQLISIVDYAGTAATNNITVAGNGNNIQGSTSNRVINTNREAINLVYVDSTQGWLAYADVYSTTAPLPVLYTATYLVVAGGGGGSTNNGGGGGAGGYLTGTLSLSQGTVYTAVVGGGGAGVAYPASGNATNGSNSTFPGITSAVGGGGAGGGTAGSSGGSGGGSGNGGSPGGLGTPGQGNNGGAGTSAPNYTAAGGGGAGAAGSNGTPAAGGQGGNGTANSITGSSVTYAGGGGGSCNSPATAGLGGPGTPGVSGGNGGFNISGTAGVVNTGGGGGGTNNAVGTSGGAGGSGVVILSVPTANYSGTTTGSPTITTSGSNTIIKWTSGSGTYTA